MDSKLVSCLAVFKKLLFREKRKEKPKRSAGCLCMVLVKKMLIIKFNAVFVDKVSLDACG